jgi:hypothetical protein
MATMLAVAKTVNEWPTGHPSLDAQLQSDTRVIPLADSEVAVYGHQLCLLEDELDKSRLAFSNFLTND